VVLRKERRVVQSVQIYQTKTHIHENEHDKRYKCVEMQCQDIDN
jgi:hypothetical protein